MEIMSAGSNIIGTKNSDTDSAANKLKIGEIFLLKDRSQILNCIQCSREFQHFTEFTLHVQEHYSHYKIEPFQPKVEIGIEEVLIKIEAEQGFEGSHRDYIDNDDAELFDPVDQFVCTATEKIETKPNIKEEVEKDESDDFTCEICGWVCKHKRYLKHHIETHSDNRVSCEICGKKITARNIKGHMKIHTSSPEFLCSICGMRFSNKGNLKLHRVVHDQDYKYDCDFCQKKFIRSDKALTHIRKNHDEHIKFHCSSCNLGFMSKRSMVRHENIHLTKPNDDLQVERRKEYPCDVCDVIYKTRKAWRLHTNKHLTNATIRISRISSDVAATFQCSACDLRFKSKWSMGRHQKKKHPELTNESLNVPCEYCGKEVLERYLGQHIRRQHVNFAKKDYVCSVCGKTFIGNQHLRQHLRTHDKPTSPPLKAPCEHCGKEVYAKNMSQHVKIHTAKKDFVCSVCSKRFIRNKLLQQHHITHQQSFQYKCDFCPEKYQRYGQYLAHLRKDHVESMRYHCSTCNMGFMHTAALTTHETKHLLNVT